VGIRQAGIQDAIKGRVITALGASALHRLAARAGLPCALELWGVYDFAGGTARYAALMENWLARAPAGAVLMCHPAEEGNGTANSVADRQDPIAPARRWEFEVLGGAALGQALARHGVALVRGSAALC
jgi:hypothetical protein